MVKLNHHYQKLSHTYLFPEIEKKVAQHKTRTPNAPVLNLGIGDATIPIPNAAVRALVGAAKEMGKKKTFRGYGPSEGYLFLRQAIADTDYPKLQISPEEIFISDGANTDIANLQELFSVENKIAVPDPSYPVYVDSNVMAGRTRPLLKTGLYGGVIYLPCVEEQEFQPLPPDAHADIIYLCSPNNPTGAAMDRALLQKWVRYAQAHKSIILFDGAYEAYITTGKPRSIYEIEGAKQVAIEVRSFSKSAGFTGMRCSYTVVPKQLLVRDAGTTQALHALWQRRIETKSNGVSYPIQRAAAALYTPDGQSEMRLIVQNYLERAHLLRDGLTKLGFTVYGGVDSPYIWCKTPDNIPSWQFFDQLLQQAHIVSIPGSGFGREGDGYVRFSAFAEKSAIVDSLQRIKKSL